MDGQTTLHFLEHGFGPVLAEIGDVYDKEDGRKRK